MLAMLLSIIRLARPQQWLKNGILLAPLIFAGEMTDIDKLLTALAATALFCLFSSVIYMFNDFVDYEKDRLHPAKKNRPIASGAISRTTAVFVMIIILAAAFILSAMVGSAFLVISMVFVAINLLYTIWFKNVVIVDAMSVAISFVIRAYAGALAIDVAASKWLLINTLLLALFLAFGKRRHELVFLEEDATAHRKILIKYSPYLLDQLIGVVTASVVVMYMLYSFSTEVSLKLGTENLFLTIPFVVYGIFRYLYLIHKEEKGGSPTKVLISDWPILATVVLWLITAIIILYVV
ncbi:MAG: decaprenyl-phosphate phosphoribosyltransferase [Candidatus Zixiibacteriota bacterium]|nr:MAG: decaprenyl-phosphate phosphoribosyltransferase [candidate division Zixibacteria bacterium]